MRDEVKKRLGIPHERNEDQMENEAQGAGVLCRGCYTSPPNSSEGGNQRGACGFNPVVHRCSPRG